MSLKITDDTTIEDVFLDPHKYGAPSFDEFKKNPDKYRISHEQSFISADKGSQILKKVNKQKYFVNGYRCSSIEQAYRVAQDMGLDLYKLSLEPEVRQNTSGGYEIEVHFKQKTKEGL